MTQKLAEVRKFLAAAAGAVAAIVSSQTLHGQAQQYAVLASTVLSAFLVYVLPNAQALITATGPSLIQELKTVVTHPDVMPVLVEAIKAELRAQAAAQSKVATTAGNPTITVNPAPNVTYQPATAGPSTDAPQVTPIPPLIPPGS